jgi:PhoD-like phosphatase
MSEVQAVAPSCGLIVQVEDAIVRVQASDSGGRSFPDFAALVSVSHHGDKLQLIGHPQAGQDDRGLRAQGLMFLRVEDGESPYIFEIPRSDWPDSELVLLLLGYNQVRGIGGTTRPRRRRKSNKIDAVKQALAEDGMNELRSGLICGNLFSPSHTSTHERRDVTFAVASCQFPSDFLDHMPWDEHAARGPADGSLLHLSDLLGKGDSPTLLLLAGDQIYVDSTAGLFDPKVKDDVFRLPYERRGQSRGIMAVMQRLDLRVESILDDHEIRDNWEPNDPPNRVADGKEAYFIFQRALRKTPPSARVWRNFNHEGIPFFLGDTRTERQGRTALNWRRARIMSSEQCQTLLSWITATNNAGFPKFVLTASAFLPRNLDVARDSACALHSDAWDGYPRSQHALLKFACDNEVKGLVFLSGDEHICSFTKATVTCMRTKRSAVLHSIHSSGLYAPYPFANAKPEDFPSTDNFMFPHPQRGPYHCAVETYFADERDGFALVTARPENQDWELQVTFHSADGAKPNQPPRVRLEL